MRNWLVALLLLFLTGCSGILLSRNSDNSIKVKYNKLQKQYAQGVISLPLIISNKGNKDVELLWRRELETFESATEVESEDGKGEILSNNHSPNLMTFSKSLLKAGENISCSAEVVNNLKEGKYRIRTHLRLSSGKPVYTDWGVITVITGKKHEIRK